MRLDHPPSTPDERADWLLRYAKTCPHLMMHLLETLGEDDLVADYAAMFLNPRTRRRTAVARVRRDLDQLVSSGQLNTRITTGARDWCFVTGTHTDPSRWREWYLKSRVDALNTPGAL